MNTLKDIQAKFDACVLVSPTSWGGSFSKTVKALVEAKAKAGNSGVSATVTFLTIPAVARGISNIRSFLEANCLLRNPLGQYVISEEKFKLVEERVKAQNEEIQAEITKLVDNYDKNRADYSDELAAYLGKTLGVRKSKEVHRSIMSNYPTVADISNAAVSLQLDYVVGSNGLTEDTIKAVDESKATALVASYQNMVERAIEPMYSKLGQLINQNMIDKMSERTLNSYRQAVKNLREDNVILCNDSLESLCTCGFMAVHNSDFAEMLLVNIYRLAKTANIANFLPDIERYDKNVLEELAADTGMPSLEELVLKARKILTEKEEESE